MNPEPTKNEREVIEQALREFNRKRKTQYTYQDLLKRPTLRTLLKFSMSNLYFRDETQIWLLNDLSKEPQRPMPIKSDSPKEIKKCLITGGVGFLGSHLVDELWHHTTFDIYLLIKASSPQEALNRLKQAEKTYHLKDQTREKRVHLVLGDLSKPRLGLSNDDYNKLTYEIDAICHVGARVHHIYDYMTLRHTNVLSTHALVDFALTYKNKFFYYISSIAAVSKKNKAGQFSEDIDSNFSCKHEDGYTQSKYASEHYLAKAALKGLPVSIFRPSDISGRTHDGVCSPIKNHFLNLIKGCIQMKKAPDWRMKYHLVPVDQVCQIIRHTLLKPSQDLRVLNIVNNHELHWSFLISWLQKRGYPIELTLEDEWSEVHLAKIDRANALYPFISMYSNRLNNLDEQTFEYNPSSNISVTYETQNTDKVLKKEGLIWAEPNARMLENYFDYLKNIGFIPDPQKNL